MMRFKTSIICLSLSILLYVALVMAGEPVPAVAVGVPPDGGWAAWLQTYGGWGVSILLIAAFIAFYRDTKNDFKERQKEFASIQRESIAVMQTISTNQIHLNNTLQQVNQSLTANTNLVGQQAALLERANQAIARCENATPTERHRRVP